MKFFAVFAAVLAVACGKATWTLDQLSDAIQNPTTDPAYIPLLEHNLNQMMYDVVTGQHPTSVSVTIPAVDLSAWTMHELSLAIENPETDPALLPSLMNALNEMILAAHGDYVVPVIAFEAPAMDLSYWTLQELSEALSNPQTSAALVPYLEHALNEIMDNLISGTDVEAIVVVTPAGLLQDDTPVIPIVPAPAEEVAVPAPAGSPLVQIIVNVNAQAAGVAPPSPAEPVIVVDQPSPEVDPVDVIAVNPVQVNPIDFLHPVPV